MKSLPLALDRLLANPSFERIDGKLIKVFEDRTRIILELKGKKLKTLLGPFHDAEWANLVDKAIIAFVKPGEVTSVYDAKAIPKAQRTPAKTASATGEGASGKRGPKPKIEGGPGYTPRVRWKKYAEGRMVGEPVKLLSMERGFGLEMDLIMGILQHLGIVPGTVTKAVAYLDFRKFFHFIIDPNFKNFQNNFVPKQAKPAEQEAPEPVGAVAEPAPEPEEVVEAPVAKPQPPVEKKVELVPPVRPKVAKKTETQGEPQRKSEPKDDSEEE